MSGKIASRWSVLVAAGFAVALGLMLGAGGGQVAGATRTLTPEEESAIPTVDPAHMVPDEIMVQFSRKMSGPELSAFEARFDLDLISKLDGTPDEPYYEYRILDGATPPDKRLEILAGEPLVAWCQPNVTGQLLVDGGPAATPTVAPTAAPTPSPAATQAAISPSPLAAATPTSSRSEVVSVGLPLVLLGGSLGLAALVVFGGLFVLVGRRAR
jgi:hypothetical protein